MPSFLFLLLLLSARLRKARRRRKNRAYAQKSREKRLGKFQELAEEKESIDSERATLQQLLAQLRSENASLKQRELFLNRLCQTHQIKA
jgi:hypothetical protein